MPYPSITKAWPTRTDSTAAAPAKRTTTTTPAKPTDRCPWPTELTCPWSFHSWFPKNSYLDHGSPRVGFLFLPVASGSLVDRRPHLDQNDSRDCFCIHLASCCEEGSFLLSADVCVGSSFFPPLASFCEEDSCFSPGSSFHRSRRASGRRLRPLCLWFWCSGQGHHHR